MTSKANETNETFVFFGFCDLHPSRAEWPFSKITLVFSHGILNNFSKVLLDASEGLIFIPLTPNGLFQNSPS